MTKQELVDIKASVFEDELFKEGQESQRYVVMLKSLIKEIERLQNLNNLSLYYLNELAEDQDQDMVDVATKLKTLV
jgi:hypothetical protein